MGKIIYPNIDLRNIKTIFIDIDDTLYLYEPCHQYAIEYCAKEIIMRYPAIINKSDFKQKYRECRNNVTKRLWPQGVCRSRLIAFMELFAELGINNSYNLAFEFDKMYWDKFISNIEIEEDAKKLLEDAYNKNITVVAVTDMTTVEQIKKINKMGIDKYIKYIVTSEIAGSEKPDKKIFSYALDIANAYKENTIMIGDSVEKDGEGAKAMGINFYQVILDV